MSASCNFLGWTEEKKTPCSLSRGHDHLLCQPPVSPACCCSWCDPKSHERHWPRYLPTRNWRGLYFPKQLISDVLPNHVEVFKTAWRNCVNDRTKTYVVLLLFPADKIVTDLTLSKSGMASVKNYTFISTCYWIEYISMTNTLKHSLNIMNE